MNNSSGHNIMTREELETSQKNACNSLATLYDEGGDGTFSNLKEKFSFLESGAWTGIKANSYKAKLDSIFEKYSKIFNKIPALNTVIGNITFELINADMQTNSEDNIDSSTWKANFDDADLSSVALGTFGGIFSSPFAKDKDVEITSVYGNRVLNGKSEFHKGIDLVPTDRDSDAQLYPVLAGGEVISVIPNNGTAGNTVVIRYKEPNGDGYIDVRYIHMKNINPDLHENDVVDEDTVLGTMGNTGASQGAHLHLDISKISEAGKNEGYVDPFEYLFPEEGKNADYSVFKIE